MSLRRVEWKKGGEIHSWQSIVENKHATGRWKVPQHVLHLGETNYSKAAARPNNRPESHPPTFTGRATCGEDLFS